MNKKIELIEEGKCPFCKKEVYFPSSEAGSLAYHIGVGMHMANCDKNPDYKESELAKFMRELMEGE